MKKAILLGLAVALAIVGFLALPGGRGWLTSTGLLGEERLVRSRIDAYWTARVHGDYAAMSEYQHPEQPDVADSGLLSTESYEIRSLQIDGDQAVVEVALKARVRHPKMANLEREIVAQEHWVKLDGSWHRDKQATSLKEMFKGVQERLHPSGDTAPDGDGGPGVGDAGGREEVSADEKS